MVGHYDSLHAREVIRFDHVTLTPVQAASAVATDTPPLPLASQTSPLRSADGRPAQAADVTLTRRAARPIELQSNKRRLGACDLGRLDEIASRVIFRAQFVCESLCATV